MSSSSSPSSSIAAQVDDAADFFPFHHRRKVPVAVVMVIALDQVQSRGFSVVGFSGYSGVKSKADVRERELMIAAFFSWITIEFGCACPRVSVERSLSFFQ